MTNLKHYSRKILSGLYEHRRRTVIRHENSITGGLTVLFYCGVCIVYNMVMALL